MPALVRRSGDKYRVMHKTRGRLELVKNRSGTPVDGGGHASEEAAIAQARAINAGRRDRR